MIITYRGTEITMERTMSYGHYRINQFDCHGRRIFSSIVTDSMTYDDYTSLKGEWFNSGRQRDAMLQRVRALLRREKEARW